MNGILKRKGYWIAGTTVALAGVAAVRLVAPGLSGGMNQAVTISGYVLSLVGIFILACGSGERSRWCGHAFCAGRKSRSIKNLNKVPLLMQKNHWITNYKEDSFMITEILVPMSGMIARILVNVGDQIDEDDELLILEAMKMENPIFSTAGGMVKEIKVKVGQSVSADQVLVLIE
jgi:acetyl-CoA carboxylase biotin carboxyl carrier protein